MTKLGVGSEVRIEQFAVPEYRVEKLAAPRNILVIPGQVAGSGAGGDVDGPASAVNNNLAAYDGTTGKLLKDSGLATSAVATLTGTQTLTNKTLTAPVVNSPTGIVKGDVGLGNVANVDQQNASNLTSGTVAPARLGSGSGGATKFLREDSSWQTISAGSGDVVGPASSTDGHLAQFDGTTGKLLKGGKAAPSGAVVGTTDTQTLTNKTLTAPAISSPTGIVKGDVGLGNVDNTSDATKNAASVTLTNKTISGASNTLTNISADSTVDGATNHVFTAADDTKLAGIATGATANDTDANLKNRANHTGTQTLATISDVTASAAEVNVLDGVTSSTAELNLLDGVTATTAELNHVDGVTSAIQTQLDGKVPTTRTVNGHALSANVTVTADDVLPTQTGNSGEFLTTNGTTASWAPLAGGGDMSAATYDPQAIADDAFDRANHTGTQNLATIGDVTASAAEVNVLDGVTASTAELNILDGVTATAAELNALDGITATVTELNYTDGVTSAIQTQLNTGATNLSNHLSDTTDAHDASAISADTTAADVLTGDDVQEVFTALDANMSDHYTGAGNRHAAVDVDYAGSTNLSATNVEAALDELDTEKASTGSVSTVQTNLDNHVNDTTDAHDASAISVDPSSFEIVGSTDAQGAIGELDSGVVTVQNDVISKMTKNLGGSEEAEAASGTSGTVTLDCSLANVFTLSPTGNVTTLTISNPPSTGTACTISLIVSQGATPRTIATPTGGVFIGAATPTQVANKICVFTYLTVDGGTTWICSAAVQV